MPTLNSVYVHPPARSLPLWPAGDLDTSARSHLIVPIGGRAETDLARQRLRQAQLLAPSTLLAFAALGPAEADTLSAVYRSARVGLRVLIIGGQFDVFQALAAARGAGLLPPELRCILTHTRDLPMFCAHCRATSRVAAAPGSLVTCPGCARTLEIHEHTSSRRGSFLASQAAVPNTLAQAA
ncbi:hypothetical protein E3O25_13745 [Cryobacterium sp. TMT1-3]|uniref:Dimethylamine monooxygenase subunit DmmA-like C-terminal domain-containing protein n=1 Tax=Cryobacterium luteum TaxID=1424661 RepID=A0A1H8K8V1_9MICO|nr:MULTISPECIES: dimethylamine monooxygenase subunit DmmA family protein [Cryobacterium]TFB92377.1 hypothetical protein E3O10_04880 [Cryobacterium luteum]TFC25067.1 hypothetical protein E3O25_13745 [Cryobacterium sp. TMT1-3]SEN89285.1 hypothetical protein SAMN05216281_11813 [Cryobacterium luteum]